MNSSVPGSGGSVWAAVKAVAWSFLGIRRSSAFQEDMVRIKPYHLIAVGIVAALMFVLFLIGLVQWIVAK